MSEPIQETRFERVTRSVSTIERTVLWGFACLLTAAITWACVELALTERSVRSTTNDSHELIAKANAVLDTFNGQTLPAVDTSLATLSTTVANVGGTTHAINQVLDETRGAIIAARKTVLPPFADAARNLDAASREAEPIASIARGAAEKVTLTLADIDGTVKTVNGTLLETRTFAKNEEPELAATVANLKAASANFVLVTDDLARARLAERLGPVADNGVLISANTAAVTGDLKAESSYLRTKIIPAPYAPTGSAFVRGAKTTGHYLLQIVKASPTLTLGIIRLVAVQ